MRTNIEIDDKLMKRAMKATGATTKRAAVEASMRLAVQLKAQEGIRELRGKVKWEGDLEEMRRGRFTNWQEDAEKAGQSMPTITEWIANQKKAS
jgi:Arc/MetJ family transcription regulator